MTEADIFDLNNLSDIPNEIKSDLKVLSRDGFEKKIIDIFKKANRELNIDEITVGYYRVYKEVKERRQVMTKLYNMARSPRPAIEAMPQKGVYKLILEEDEVHPS
ncbi:MAG: hypothetical protein O2832_02140 [Proteobacteria bacterium]|nr:hypothetical protein [Pseudomonadota bacterium]